jgi:toxin HigB-1
MGFARIYPSEPQAEAALPVLALESQQLASCTIEWYKHSSWSCEMIVNFRDDWLRDFFAEDVRSRRIPSGLEDRLFRKIQMIDDAATDQDLRVPPSNHFEKLRGNLEGLHSIRVNRQWRLVFRWDGRRGEATDIYLDDHSYR